MNSRSKARRDTNGTLAEGLIHKILKIQRFFRSSGVKRKPTEGWGGIFSRQPSLNSIRADDIATTDLDLQLG
jgi:hypothetical protein